MSDMPFTFWAMSAHESEHVIRQFEQADREITTLRAENTELRKQNDSLCKRVIGFESGVCWVKANAELETLRAELAAERERADGLAKAMHEAIDEARAINDNTDPLVDYILKPALAAHEGKEP